MSELSIPLPSPDALTQPFWDACRERVLRVMQCASCEHLFLPAAPCCPCCWSDDLSMVDVSGDGRVFSYVVYRRTYHPAFPAPYVVALIELAEGPRLISNVIGCEPEDVEIGLAVEVTFRSAGDFELPCFMPATAQEGQA
jgi:uncharacterized protein